MKSLATTTLAFLAIAITATASAQNNSVLVEGPALSSPPAVPSDAAGVVVEEVIPAVSHQRLVPVRGLKYNVRPSARRAFACHGKIDTVLAVDNHCDGTNCLYRVPVCLPGCCVGEPAVHHRRGLLGRSVVEYCWPCGYQVEVIFRLRGDVAVMMNAD